MNERIQNIRNSLGLSQEDFAKKLGLKSRGKIANIEFGKTEPDDEFIRLICKTYNVNYKWLVNGIGDMFKEKDNDGDAQAIVDSVMSGDNEFAKKILVKFARLSEERWRQISEILKELELDQD